MKFIHYVFKYSFTLHIYKDFLPTMYYICLCKDRMFKHLFIFVSSKPNTVCCSTTFTPGNTFKQQATKAFQRRHSFGWHRQRGASLALRAGGTVDGSENGHPPVEVGS